MLPRELIVLSKDSDGLPDYARKPLVDLLAYWRSKRDASGLPTRDAIDPLDIPTILPNLSILDVEGDRFRFHLVGEAVNARYGGQIKGHTLDELMTGRALETTIEEHALCVRKRAPVFTRNTDRSRSALEDMQVYQRLDLPVGHDGAVEAIIGAMIFETP